MIMMLFLLTLLSHTKKNLQMEVRLEALWLNNDEFEITMMLFVLTLLSHTKKNLQMELLIRRTPIK